MQREVALRRALQDARDRREREFQAVQERARTVRRRLRELTDRLGALDLVQERFPPGASEKPATPQTPAPPSPVPTAESPPAPSPLASLPPSPWPDHVREKLLATLGERHPDGFTVGQLRDALDEVDEARSHTYDAAWSLANTLVRSRAVELAGTRPGPKVPVRVFRIPEAHGATGTAPEVR